MAIAVLPLLSNPFIKFFVRFTYVFKIYLRPFIKPKTQGLGVCATCTPVCKNRNVLVPAITSYKC